MENDEINIVRANLCNSMPNLCTSLGLIKPSSKQGSKWRYGSNGSMCVTMSGKDVGAWYSHEDGQGGYVFELIMHTFGYNFAQAIDWAKKWLGADLDSEIKYQIPTKTCEKPENPNKSIAMKVWSDSLPIKGTLGENYLNGRHITELPSEDVIRFHPNTKYITYIDGKKTYGEAPAIILLIKDIDTEEPIAIQRRFLSPDAKKHPLFKKSMSLGLTKHGAIMFTPKTDSFGLNICEGFEDGLSNMQLGFSNVWVLMGTSGILHFPVLNEVEWLRIIADPDKGGLEQANKCVERWKEAGKTANCVTPPDNLDSNEYLKKITLDKHAKT